MGKYRNFELSEFIKSDTARWRLIDNTPSFEVVDHINELVGDFLQPLREAYGRPITITSGYRCPKLNRIVGGVDTSVHMVGYAADTQAADFDGYVAFVLSWVKHHDIAFDQLLIEKKGSTRWLHIGLRNNKGEQRGQINTINL